MNVGFSTDSPHTPDKNLKCCIGEFDLTVTVKVHQSKGTSVKYSDGIAMVQTTTKCLSKTKSPDPNLVKILTCENCKEYAEENTDYDIYSENLGGGIFNFTIRAKTYLGCCEEGSPDQVWSHTYPDGGDLTNDPIEGEVPVGGSQYDDIAKDLLERFGFGGSQYKVDDHHGTGDPYFPPCRGSERGNPGFT